MTGAVRWSASSESFIREDSREDEKSKEEMVMQATLEEFDYERKQKRKNVGSRESFLVVFNIGE